MRYAHNDVFDVFLSCVLKHRFECDYSRFCSFSRISFLSLAVNLRTLRTFCAESGPVLRFGSATAPSLSFCQQKPQTAWLLQTYCIATSVPERWAHAQTPHHTTTCRLYWAFTRVPWRFGTVLKCKTAEDPSWKVSLDFWFEDPLAWQTTQCCLSKWFTSDGFWGDRGKHNGDHTSCTGLCSIAISKTLIGDGRHRSCMLWGGRTCSWRRTSVTDWKGEEGLTFKLCLYFDAANLLSYISMQK